NTALNTIVIAEEKPNISTYKLEYFANGSWKPLFEGENKHKIKIHRFDSVKAEKVRMAIAKSAHQASIAEFQIYNEKR
ncbi:MAG: carbohydrate-binding protein, partial [Pedobacter sp.]|nr:carbohydrate-binding protein [Pedobacter sp.]